MKNLRASQKGKFTKALPRFAPGAPRPDYLPDALLPKARGRRGPVTGCEDPETVSRAVAVFWFAVGVWRRFAEMTPEERKTAANAVSDALAFSADVAIGKGELDIPGFGKCSGCRALAIMSCYIVSRAKTEHVDSPFLAVARDARRFQACLDGPGVRKEKA